MSAIHFVVLFVMQMTVAFSAISDQKCKLSDSNCLKSAAQAATPTLAAGMPGVGTEPLDVMHIDSIKVDLAGLHLVVTDATVKGLKKSIIDRVNIDMAKKVAFVSWDADVVLRGKYKASGRLLILPITGDGDMTMKLKKLHIEMTIPFDIIKRDDGRDGMDLKSYKYKFEVKEGANFQLTNLFNGNKALSDTMIKFMNENWKILSQEFGGPMLEKPNKKVFDAIKKYLKSEALEDISDYN